MVRESREHRGGVAPYQGQRAEEFIKPFPLWLSASDGNFYLLFLSMQKSYIVSKPEMVGDKVYRSAKEENAPISRITPSFCVPGMMF